jgi:hypothetical protein
MRLKDLLPPILAALFLTFLFCGTKSYEPVEIEDLCRP